MNFRSGDHEYEVKDSRPHLVQFYDSDDQLVDSLVEFFTVPIGNGDLAILIASAPVIGAFDRALSDGGFSVGSLKRSGRLMCIDAEATLAGILRDGMPDRDIFFELIGGLVTRSLASGRKLYMFGEMVAILWNEGNRDAALALENLWTELARSHPFSLFCAYPATGFQGPGDLPAVEKIGQVHTHIIPSAAVANGDISTIISQLEKRTAGLEAEVARHRRAELDMAMQVDELERLHWINRKLIATDDLDTCFDLILKAFVEMEGTQWGALSLFDEESSKLTVKSCIGHLPELLKPGATFSSTQGSSGHCIASRAQVVVEDVTISPLFAGVEDLMRSLGVVSTHSIPLITFEGQIIGALSAHFKTKTRPTPRQQRLADLYASDVANLISRRHAEKALRASENKLKESDCFKDEFLAMLAHELRNPLSAIAGAVGTLERDRCSEKDRHLAQEVMKRQVCQLSSLLDDLLDVSRITSGKIVLKQELIYLREVVGRAVQVVRPLYEKMNHRLSVSSLGLEPCWMNGDPTRIEQIIVNLLANAANYTPAGGEIKLSCEHQGDRVLISITDSGVGIAKEMLPRIFELFTQDKRTLDRSQGGLGVGLCVVKRLVELHHGTIEARSEGAGKGSEFRMTFPAADKPVVAAAAPEHADTSCLPLNILVVDDNCDAALALSLLLQSEGHVVSVANHATQALEIVRTFQPDVALLDIGLPEITGYELAEKLRAEANLSNIKLIAITGYGQAEDRARSFQAGFDYHMTKPVDYDLLLKLLKEKAGLSKTA